VDNDFSQVSELTRRNLALANRNRELADRVARESRRNLGVGLALVAVATSQVWAVYAHGLWAWAGAAAASFVCGWWGRGFVDLAYRIERPKREAR
jgi:hypothetical protein